VFSVLFAGADRSATTSNNQRDAMHVATAIRYGYNGFLTRERRLLNEANPARAGFNGFRILDPEVRRRSPAGGFQRLAEIPADTVALSDPRILGDRDRPLRRSPVLRESR
jgi:hypothetical protein